MIIPSCTFYTLSKICFELQQLSSPSLNCVVIYIIFSLLILGNLQKMHLQESKKKTYNINIELFTCMALGYFVIQRINLCMLYKMDKISKNVLSNVMQGRNTSYVVAQLVHSHWLWKARIALKLMKWDEI